MPRLSVNINKIALIRNARGTNTPDIITVANHLLALDSIAGLTVHPRPDGRHITYDDVRNLASLIRTFYPTHALNVEGYPSPDFLALIRETQPQQVTLVPDPPGALTSSYGWCVDTQFTLLQPAIAYLRAAGVRNLSLFLDPVLPDKSRLLTLGPDAVELHTYAYAQGYPTDPAAALRPYYQVGSEIARWGVAIHAGHDLNQTNTPYFIQNMPLIQEISIGHALVCDALLYGLVPVVNVYASVSA